MHWKIVATFVEISVNLTLLNSLALKTIYAKTKIQNIIHFQLFLQHYKPFQKMQKLTPLKKFIPLSHTLCILPQD